MVNHPDIVYPLKHDDRAEGLPELRYSLRSLRNLPHGRVFLCGGRPPWANGVTHIPVPQHPNKYADARNNLTAALLSDEVSDPFYLFNDDFFVMRPMDHVPILHRGYLEDVIATYRNPNDGTYVRAMGYALELLRSRGIDRPLSYELHLPLLIHKDPMIEALALREVYGPGDRYHLRTVYGNIANLGGTKTIDVKIRVSTVGEWTKWGLLSTTDSLWRHHPSSTFIRDSFPDRGVYESHP